MSSELARYARGEISPRRQDRAIAAASRDLFNEVRLATLKADGAMALAAHLMEGMTGLDEQRRSLSRGDQIADVMLAEIQIATLHAVKKIQTSLYDQWGMR